MQGEKTIAHSHSARHTLQLASIRAKWPGTITDYRIALAVRLVQEQYERSDLGISELARHLHLSGSRFRHLFLQQTGIPPSRFLKQVRLRKAKVLLETSFFAVKEVMHMVGYTDASHFTKDYRAAYHLPPRRYRHQFFTATAGSAKK
jgi:transcriptional regulator GlxA family with amidase domain